MIVAGVLNKTPHDQNFYMQCVISILHTETPYNIGKI